MSSFIAVLDDSIAFFTKQLKPNGTYINLPFDALFTKYGMVLPLECVPFAVIDYLEGGFDVFDAWGELSFVGAILTPSGKIYEFFRDDLKRNVWRRQILHGQGALCVRAGSIDIEEAMNAALFLTRELGRAVGLTSKVITKIKPEGLHVFAIAELVKMLHSRGFTEDHPWPKHTRPPTNQITDS